MATAARIKFCGITRLEDAEHAVALGAWAVGLILWPGSPRRCSQDEAAVICAALRRRAEVVGVFVNAHLDEVTAAADALGLTIVQLHGDEGPSYAAEAARRTGAKIIKVARVRDRHDIRALRSFHTDFHLLDAYQPDLPGGTGETFAWDLVAEHPRDRPLVLSGGLTAENVGDAIAATRPFAVDVASGVETAPGIKDHALMDAFAASVAATAGSPAAPDSLSANPPTAPGSPAVPDSLSANPPTASSRGVEVA